MTTQDQKQAPLQTFRDGAVTIKLWEQATPERSFVNTTVGRVYKDKATGEFKESRSFNDTDLLKLQAMIPEARQEIKKWQEYFRETDRQQETPQPQPSQQPDMAAQRDAALAAAPNQQGLQQSQEHVQTPIKEHSR